MQPGSRQRPLICRQRRGRVHKVGRCGAHRQINFGSQGGPCDPSTKNHAGGTPASSLLRGYHTLLHPPCRKVRTTFQLLSGSLSPATHSQVPSLSLHQMEVVARLSDEPLVCPSVFLYSDAEETMEADAPYPKKIHRLTTISQPGRGSTTHRRRSHSVLPHHTHDSLRHRCSECGVDAFEGQRH